jgi:hypothetical protein
MGLRAKLATLTAILAGLLVPASAGAETIYTIDNAAPPMLQSFDSATPGTLTNVGSVTGLQAGERLMGIDIKPDSGELYGVGSTSRLYKISRATGAATAVGTGGFGLLFGVQDAMDMDFDPTTGLLRIVTDTKQNVRVNAESGQIAYRDGDIHPGDSDISPNPSVAGLGYSNNYRGSTDSVLRGYEYNADDVVILGVTSGPTVAEVGVVYEVSDMPGIVVQGGSSPRIGYDVSPGGTTYASLLVGGSYNLYRVSNAGTVTLVGPIGTGSGAQRDIAVAPTVNAFSFSATSYTVDETAHNATITLNRSAPQIGSAQVGVAVTDGSATAGSDYENSSRAVKFGVGDATATFTIPIYDDPAVEGDETVNLTLGEPIGGDATTASPNTATLTIHSDDSAPPAAPDTTAPTAVLAAPKSRTLKQLLKGVTATGTPTEPASLEFTLLATARSATAAAADNLVLARKFLPLGAGARSVKLKPSKQLVARQRKSFKVRVQVIATDAAGNRSTPVKRTVSVKVPKRKKR